MIHLILSVAATMMTPQQTEQFCYAMADFSVAAVEAREAGVPLDTVLEYVRSLGDESGVLRAQVIQVYSASSNGARMTDNERQRAINEIAAKCIGDMQ